MKAKDEKLVQMDIAWLRIPAGRRQTSCLFTRVTEELNCSLTKNNSSIVVKVGLEPTTSMASTLTTQLQVCCLNFGVLSHIVRSSKEFNCNILSSLLILMSFFIIKRMDALALQSDIYKRSNKASEFQTQMMVSF